MLTIYIIGFLLTLAFNGFAFGQSGYPLREFSTWKIFLLSLLWPIYLSVVVCTMIFSVCFHLGGGKS